MCKCKVCNQLKVRMDGGKRATGTGRKRIDETGRAWNGLTCPDCRYLAVYSPRVAADSDYGPSEPLYPPKLRPCRTCKQLNPNYYDCKACLDARIYHSPDSHVGCLEEGMFEVHTGQASGTFSRGAGFRY